MRGYDVELSGECSWLRLLGAAEPAALDRAVASPLLLDQVISAAGPGAAAWAVDTTRGLCGPAVRERLFAGYGSRCDGIFVETVVLWGILRLSGVVALPHLLATELGETIRRSVEAGIPADVLLRSVRFVHAELVQALFRFCDSSLPVADRPAAMRRIVADLFDGMEVLSSFVADDFARQHARWVISGSAQDQMALVNGILGGRSIDLKKATRRLGYDLTGHHIALVLRADGPGVDRMDELKRTAGRLLEAAGCSSALMLPAGPDRLWAWGGRTGAKPAPFRQLSAVPPVPTEVHVASGLPGSELDGFRRSHDQAATAERLSGIVAPSLAGLHDYGALELVLLLSDGMSAASEFVVRELGRLAADDKPTAVLRETLLCYLEQERSVAATAKLLYVAKNTVGYRVKRAERLLGQPLRDLGENRLRLHTALYLAAKLGTRVLAPDAPAPELLGARRSA